MRKLGEYKIYLDVLLLAAAEKTEFTSAVPLEKVFAEHPKLIVTFNHAAPLSWIPAMSLMTKASCEHGGAERLPRGIMHKFFFDIPFLKPLAGYITQSEDFMGFEDLVAHLATAPQADLVVFPEGSNCFFGNPREIQDFKSPRFLEIAIRVGCPLLLAVHEGSESWGLPIPIKDEWKIALGFLPDKFSSALLRTGIFTAPMPPMRMKKFKMYTDLYFPELKKEELLEDETKRREQLWLEVEKLQNKMKAMQDHLRLM